jgi:hypothetical protein
MGAQIMRFRERAEQTAASVKDSLGLELSEAQAKGLADIIEKAIITEAREERERCAIVAKHCCKEDEDLAHKTAQTIREANEALIANLLGMR